MLLWTPIFVKNSNISATIFFIFLKNLLKQTWNSFDTKFKLQGKDLRSNYQVKENFRNFCHLIIIVLGQNNVIGLKVTKGLKKNSDSRGLERERNKIKISRENNSQIVWGYLQFSCDIADNRKSLISVFQEFSTSINKNLIFSGRLCTELLFFEI